MGSRERYIEGGHRLGETFQCQAAEVFECDYFLYGSGDATGDQDLPILRLSYRDHVRRSMIPAPNGADRGE